MLVTTKEAARLTGLSEYELRVGHKAGDYPALEVGRGSRRKNLRWDIERLQRVLDERMSAQATDRAELIERVWR